MVYFQHEKKSWRFPFSLTCFHRKMSVRMDRMFGFWGGKEPETRRITEHNVLSIGGLSHEVVLLRPGRRGILRIRLITRCPYVRALPYLSPKACFRFSEPLIMVDYSKQNTMISERSAPGFRTIMAPLTDKSAGWRRKYVHNGRGSICPFRYLT